MQALAVEVCSKVQYRYTSLDRTALENDASKINEASRQETAKKGKQIEKAFRIQSENK